MKNICFLIGNLSNSGGTERVTSLIANELAKKNDNITILSFTDGAVPFFELNDNIKTYSLYKKEVSFKKNFLGAVWKIRKFVKQNHIETLVVVDSISCMFTVPALLGLQINHICWEHFNFNNNNGVMFRNIGRKWAAKHCDYIVTLTKRDKELWENGLRNISAKIVPIANPSPYENIQHTPSLEFKVALAIGRLTHVKGFDMLIESWAKVCYVNHDWKLRIVGSGEEEENLKKQAKHLEIDNRIDFIPTTRDVEQYYKTSSFYCLSSRFEGLPMVLLEAQAFGLPIVAFNCDTGPSDIVTHDRNGYLIEDFSVLEYSKAILQLINEKEKYSSLVSNTKKNTKIFDVSEIVKQWKLLL